MTPPEDLTDADADITELRRRVAYLEETLAAINSGGVDAVVLGAPEAKQVYTLASADLPYRIIVERLGEGAATVSDRGVILFANPQLALVLGVGRDAMVGRDLADYVADDQRNALEVLLQTRTTETWRAELAIRSTDGADIPVLIAATALEMQSELVRCLVFTDLRMQKRIEQQMAETAAHAERQRVAREVNDTIVQGLVTAEMALDLELYSDARKAIAATSGRARRWIGELALDHQVEAGTAVRSAAASSETP